MEFVVVLQVNEFVVVSEVVLEEVFDVVLLQCDQWVVKLVEVNVVYQGGDFCGVCDFYFEIVEFGVVNGQLQYNFGNVSLCSGFLGELIVVYFRVLVLCFCDQDVFVNFQFVCMQVKDVFEFFVFLDVWWILVFWYFLLSLCEFVFVVFGFNVFFWLVLVLCVQLFWFEVMCWFSGLLFVVFVVVGVFVVWWVVVLVEVVVVVVDEVEVFLGFIEDVVVCFKLCEGFEVVVCECCEMYVCVVLLMGEQGWFVVGDVDVVWWQ